MTKGLGTRRPRSAPVRRMLALACVAAFVLGRADAAQLPAEDFEDKARALSETYTSNKREQYLDRLRELKRRVGDHEALDGIDVAVPAARSVSYRVDPELARPEQARLSGRYVIRYPRATLDRRELASNETSALMLDLPLHAELRVSTQARRFRGTRACESTCREPDGTSESCPGRRDEIDDERIRISHLQLALPGALGVASPGFAFDPETSTLSANRIDAATEVSVEAGGGGVLTGGITRCVPVADRPDEAARTSPHVASAGRLAAANVFSFEMDGADSGFFQRRSDLFFGNGARFTRVALRPYVRYMIEGETKQRDLDASKYLIANRTGPIGVAPDRPGRLLVGERGSVGVGEIAVRPIADGLGERRHRFTVNEILPVIFDKEHLAVGGTAHAALRVRGPVDLSRYRVEWSSNNQVALAQPVTTFEDRGDVQVAIVSLTATGEGVFRDMRSVLAAADAEDAGGERAARPPPAINLGHFGRLEWRLVRDTDDRVVGRGEAAGLAVGPELVDAELRGGYGGSLGEGPVDLFVPRGSATAFFRTDLTFRAGTEEMRLAAEAARTSELVRLQAARDAPVETIPGAGVRMRQDDSAPTGRTAVRGVIDTASLRSRASATVAGGERALATDPIVLTLNRATQVSRVTREGRRIEKLIVLGPADMSAYRAVWRDGDERRVTDFEEVDGSWVSTLETTLEQAAPFATIETAAGEEVADLSRGTGEDGTRSDRIAPVVALDAPALVQGGPLRVEARIANLPRQYWPRVYCRWSMNERFGRVIEPESDVDMASPASGSCHSEIELREAIETIDQRPDLKVELMLKD